MRADVEVQARAVLEEDVGGAAPVHDPAEEVPCHLVGRQASLPAERAGDAVLVLEPEDPPVHGRKPTPGCRERRERQRRRLSRRGSRPISGVFEAAELPAVRPRAVQHAGLDASASIVRPSGDPRTSTAVADGRREVPALRVAAFEGLGEVLGVSADRDEPVLVVDGAVEQHVVDRAARGVAVDLAHEDLDLVGLHLLGEDVREGLGVGVREVARLHVLAPVGVAAQVGEADARDPQVLELAVLARRPRTRSGRRSR